MFHTENMEVSEAATRRMNRIAGHINAFQQSSCNPSLATVVCSAGSGIQPGGRKDSRLLYARQGSHIQTFYTREIMESQVCGAGSGSQPGIRKDRRLSYARQGCHNRALYMRESIESQGMLPAEKEDSAPEQVHHTTNCCLVMNPPLNTKGDPLFSRPSSKCKDAKEYGGLSSDEGPLFAKSAHHSSDDKAPALEPVHGMMQHSIDKNNGLEWLPRTDIAESRTAYIVTVELPGVNAEGVHVEVNNNRLLVSGTRSTGWWVDHSKHNQGGLYHCRELPQGPYRVLWPIPKDSNMDFISAEFIDGFLRILVPKVML